VTPGTAAGSAGLTHELLLHRSVEELLDFVVPFVRDGVAAGEPTLLLVRPETAGLLLPRLKPSPLLTLLPALGWSGRPATALRAADSLFADHAARGPRLRVINEEPVVDARDWHDWRQLEAAVNVALDQRDLWLVCAYDRHPLDDGMVDDLHATHDAIGHAEQHLRNDRFEDPFAFIGRHRDAPPDPVESTPPAVELVDPSPASARAAVGRSADGRRLPPLEIENLVLATHEVLTNAVGHGRAPVVVRIWHSPGRVTVTVTDRGPGPADPFAGLLPPEHRLARGLGLWLSQQLVDVAQRRHPDGFTVRLTGGRPPAA
jgi:anti-sigma regulatory factor (Ser/Thr protein kinase)